MSERLAAINTDERLDSLERWRDEVNETLEEAFPAGDHVGHRKYHELQMELLAEKRRLRQAVLEKTISGLVWSFIVITALAFWHYVVTKVKGG